MVLSLQIFFRRKRKDSRSAELDSRDFPVGESVQCDCCRSRLIARSSSKSNLARLAAIRARHAFQDSADQRSSVASLRFQAPSIAEKDQEQISCSRISFPNDLLPL